MLTFLLLKRRLKPAASASKEMHMTFIYILFNEDMSREYIKQGEVTTQHLQIQQ
jgi:hypothetical protein